MGAVIKIFRFDNTLRGWSISLTWVTALLFICSVGIAILFQNLKERPPIRPLSEVDLERMVVKYQNPQNKVQLRSLILSQTDLINDVYTIIKLARTFSVFLILPSAVLLLMTLMLRIRYGREIKPLKDGDS